MTEVTRLTETELLILLKAEREQALRVRSVPEHPTSHVKWIVVGTVLVFTLMLSTMWSMFVQFMSVMEKQAERSHELAMKAVAAARVSPSADPNLALYIILGLAVFFIVLGVILKLGK